MYEGSVSGVVVDEVFSHESGNVCLGGHLVQRHAGSASGDLHDSRQVGGGIEETCKEEEGEPSKWNKCKRGIREID